MKAVPEPVADQNPCRASMGILVPVVNSVAEIDFHAMVPDDVRVYTARIQNREAESIFDSATEHNRKKLDGVAEAAERIRHVRPDLVAFCCTSKSFIGGRDGNAEVTSAIADITGTAVITATSAILSALLTLGATTVGLGTPYLSQANEKLMEYLELEGFTVKVAKSIPWSDRYSPLAAYRLGQSVNQPGIDAILLSCTNFRAAEIAGLLEADAGLPVVTSNQATVWACLRTLGIGERIHGYGRLLEEDGLRKTRDIGVAGIDQPPR